MYCVYKHTSPSNKVYIGITRQNPLKRWQNGCGYKDNNYFYNAICKYGWDNFKHEILFSELSKEDACLKEIELIALYHSNDRNHGYNISKGGETCDCIIKRYGKDNNKSRPIQCYKDGILIGLFESQNIASKQLGINRKGITKNCLGKSVTYMGYTFNYADANYIKPQHVGVGNYEHKPRYKIIMCDLNDDVLQVFNSAEDASNKMNINKNGIHKCIAGVLKTYKGFKFKRG